MWPRAISTASNTTPTNPYNCIGYEAVQVGPIVNFPGESAKLPCCTSILHAGVPHQIGISQRGDITQHHVDI